MKSIIITEKDAYKQIKMVYNLPLSWIKEKTAFCVIIHTETCKKEKWNVSPITFPFLGYVLEARLNMSCKISQKEGHFFEFFYL